MGGGAGRGDLMSASRHDHISSPHPNKPCPAFQGMDGKGVGGVASFTRPEQAVQCESHTGCSTRNLPSNKEIKRVINSNVDELITSFLCS